MSAAECPYCGRPTPEPGMRCKDRAMCAQRADWAYITNALNPGRAPRAGRAGGQQQGSEPGRDSRGGET